MTPSTSGSKAESEFARATAIAAGDCPNVFHANIPDGWQQGKGAFGGLVIAILTRGLIASDDDRSRTLRSLSADLCAPALPGPAIVEVSTLRRGGSITYADARLVQDGAIIARASAALATPRPVAPAEMVATPPSRRPPWNDAAVLPIQPPLGPVFAQKYEYRSTGPLPFSGGGSPIAEGWIREKTPGASLDEAAIVGLCDAWWPTSFSIETGPRPVATIGYTMQLLIDPRTLAPKEPLFYRARGVASGDNFFVEMRELWDGSSDRVVAMNQQTFALLA
jgi:hypothetical protein